MLLLRISLVVIVSAYFVSYIAVTYHTLVEISGLHFISSTDAALIDRLTKKETHKTNHVHSVLSFSLLFVNQSTTKTQISLHYVC